MRASASSSSRASSARPIRSATDSISGSRSPRVVTAGVPIRSPLATIGGLVSNGIVFLLTVIPAFSRAFSASLPVTPLEKTSSRNRWVSVPPETIR
jgi:hypothetical protein